MSYAQIDFPRLRELLDVGARLVEVLPEDEYAEEDLPGATDIPLKKLDARRATRTSRDETPAVSVGEVLDALAEGGVLDEEDPVGPAAPVLRAAVGDVDAAGVAIFTGTEGTLLPVLRRNATVSAHTLPGPPPSSRTP